MFAALSALMLRCLRLAIWFATCDYWSSCALPPLAGVLYAFLDVCSDFFLENNINNMWAHHKCLAAHWALYTISFGLVQIIALRTGMVFAAHEKSWLDHYVVTNEALVINRISFSFIKFGVNLFLLLNIRLTFFIAYHEFDFDENNY